jgi:hypothetical protein
VAVVVTARRRQRTWAPFQPNNCAIAEYTGDRVGIGRCWHWLTEGVRPRHGNVAEAQRAYVETGAITRDYNLPPRPRRVSARIA